MTRFASRLALTMGRFSPLHVERRLHGERMQMLHRIRRVLRRL